MQLSDDFIKQMNGLLGETDCAQLLDSIEHSGPVSIRYNPFKSFKSPIDSHLKPIAWAENAYYLPQRPNFTSDPHFHAGLYYVQEASSMFLTQALSQCIDLTQPLHLLDLCAAPGGKSTLIASLIGKDSLLVSNEVIRSRAHILSENIQKWGTANVWVSNNDPKDFGTALPCFFDAIIVDAPCSGEGMFRKSERSVEEWSLNTVKHCALRQQRILHDAWESLRPGGILIYSTCTYNETENELNLAKFKEIADFDSLQLRLNPEWKVTETEINGIFGYRFYPHRTEGEGFFISVLKKAGDAAVKIPKIKKPVFSKVTSEVETNIRNWLEQKAESFDLYARGEHISAIHPKLKDAAELLSQKLSLLYGALEIATQTRKGVNPTQAAALFPGLQHSHFPCMETDLETALSYLRLDPLTAETANATREWQLVRYKGLGLGWAKRIDNRINNYYPKEWKIRLSIDKLL